MATGAGRTPCASARMARRSVSAALLLFLGLCLLKGDWGFGIGYGLREVLWKHVWLEDCVF
jgi:hypothetical protein